MKQRAKLASLLLALTVVCGIGVVWFITGRGFSARAQPLAIEAFLARRMRSLATPRAERDAQNPVANSSEILAEAMAHYADHCALCHANDGSGETSIGQGLYPKPPDLRSAGTQGLTDGEMFYIIHNGVRLTGMPAFGRGSPEEDHDSWKLVHFIRYLPALTSDELQEMKAMNPKSTHQLEEEEAIRRFLAGDDTPPSEGHKHE